MSKKKVITPSQHVSRVKETTNVFLHMANSIAQSASVMKSMAIQFDSATRDKPEDDELKVMGIGIFNENQQLLEGSVKMLEAHRELVSEPPEFYPFSTERLQDWEYNLASQCILPIGQNLDMISATMLTMGTAIDSINDTKQAVAAEAAPINDVDSVEVKDEHK